MINGMNTGKLPGLDGIPPESVKKIDRIKPVMILRYLNEIVK